LEEGGFSGPSWASWPNGLDRCWAGADRKEMKQKADRDLVWAEMGFGLPEKMRMVWKFFSTDLNLNQGLNPNQTYF
jgi:hypothetical protein